jgi:hypothetical protein
MILEVLNLLIAVQAAQATIAGTVRDEETARPLVGAVVTLPDLYRSTATDASGRYTLPGVPPGPQHLTFRFIGHAQRGLHALVPSDGRLEINVSLRAEPVRLRTIEVRPHVAIRGLERAGSTALADRSISMAAVRNHPLLAEPDAFQALEGGPVVLRPESPGGVHIRGGSSDQTGYLLDGIPVFSPYHAAGQFSAWNPDALSGVQLTSSLPLLGHSDALSGTISADTRAPGERFGVQGGLSTTQARMTLDGQIGSTGTGYLVSVRSGVQGIPFRDHDASYLRSESGDRLAKLEQPALGGVARMLAYDSGNEISTAAVADASTASTRRNEFEWESRSIGAGWSGVISGAVVDFLGWSANGDAASIWGTQSLTHLTAERRDLGLLGTMTNRSARASTTAGFRIEHSRTLYRVTSDSAVSSVNLRGRTPLAAGFAQHAMAIHPRVELIVGASVTGADSDLHLDPHVRLGWKPADRLTLSGSYARKHQFAQSLRNSESVVGNVFPVDLFIGAGAPGVPAARSDQAVIRAEYHPFTGARLELEAYRRVTDGLLLVAPRDGGPFTAGAFAIGSGRSSGFSVDVALSRARYGVIASYGLQRVRVAFEESGYVPEHGTAHLLQGGLIVFPTATTSIRLGATGALGRRTTTALGGFEWEACNLLDRGCEFAGTPRYDGEPIGATELPAYFRADLGIRKHWHLHLRDRDAIVALFATITNLLNSSNVLTYTRDPASGERVPLEMRPLAPLVVGLDWKF